MMLLLVPYAAAADDVGYHLAQARQFSKNKWYADAATEVEAGLRLPGGAQSYELHWLGAQIYYELGRMDRARELARRAADLAPGDAAREQAQTFHDYLATTFGSLTVTAPYPGMRSRLQLELSSLLLDPELKRLVNKTSLELREASDLPVTVWVPEGDYLVNGRPVHVAAGSVSQVGLELKELGARGLAALQVSRLEVSAGTSVPFGADVANLGPGGTVELAFTQPAGPILIGALAAWDARAWAGGSETVFDPYAFDGGLRVGRELVVGGPLAVRPSLGVRYGVVPGIRLDCASDGGAATCPDGGVADPVYAVHVPGRAVSPFGELVVEFREAGRSTALGVGVKASVAQAFGSVPAEGEARLPDGQLLPFTSDARWSATFLRISTTLDMAF